MKGIILAGGSGTRLYPLTKVMTKQLQPIYDKPMIYYPLSLLMLGGIRDVLMITTPHEQEHFKRLLGDGSQFGIKIEYKIQEKPNGLPEAFKIGEDFIKGDDVTLVLGDNMFYGDIGFFRRGLEEQSNKKDGVAAKVFAYPVKDPERYGVVEFDLDSKKVLSFEEKPKKPKSKYAVPGLYIFDSTVAERAKALTPSPRGETEIVDLILSYFNEGKLGVEPITRGVAWLDTGTPKSLLEASSFIAAIEERQGFKVACLEEIAYRMKFITKAEFEKVIENLPNGSYRDYLADFLDGSF